MQADVLKMVGETAFHCQECLRTLKRLATVPDVDLKTALWQALSLPLVPAPRKTTAKTKAKKKAGGGAANPFGPGSHQDLGLDELAPVNLDEERPRQPHGLRQQGITPRSAQGARLATRRGGEPTILVADIAGIPRFLRWFSSFHGNAGPPSFREQVLQACSAAGSGGDDTAQTRAASAAVKAEEKRQREAVAFAKRRAAGAATALAACQTSVAQCIECELARLRVDAERHEAILVDGRHAWDTMIADFARRAYT